MPRARARRRKPQQVSPPDLGPPLRLRASTASCCLPDQVGRAAASRAGSGRLPPGGPSGKPPASPWTCHQIDRQPTRAVTSAEISTAVGARDRLITAKQRIMDGSQASGIVLPSLATVAGPRSSLPPLVSPSVAVDDQPRTDDPDRASHQAAPEAERMPLLPASDCLNRSRGPGRSRRPRPDSRPGSSRVSAAAPPGNDGA
jgi:hypothetical protein